MKQWTKRMKTNSMLALITLCEQLERVDIQQDAKLTLVVSPQVNQPAIVIEQTDHGERMFVQSADKSRLCRASYARDGRVGSHE